MRLNDLLFDLKLKYWIFELDFKKRIKRILFCNRGYHKIIPDFTKVTNKNPGKRKRTLIDVQYFRCLNCGTLFFFTTKDKDKYLKFKEKHSIAYFEKKIRKRFGKWN